jgi:ribosomal protein S18 acetylase RimI-like enzyme
MEIRILKTKPELEKAYHVLHELRQDLDLGQFFSLYKSAKRADDYTLVAALVDGKEVGVMGYRTLYDYVHGKHLYIDDLVVSKEQRSKGIGKMLLKYAEEIAASTQCQVLRLSTGIENERGKTFYEREGWTLRSVSYKKRIESSAIA